MKSFRGDLSKAFINNQRIAQLAGVDFNSEVIKPGPIVYSRTHMVVNQFSELVQYPSCVLVTSFSDASVTDKMAERLPPNARVWYSNNVETTNPRVISFPIGLRTSPEGEVCLREAMGKIRPPQRNLVYLNCWRRIRSGNNPRRGIYEQFGNRKWITTEGGFEHVPMQQFYRQIASHPYVLSPPGAGPDCHRHWESILLGSIPIVLKRTSTDILEDLPCLRVDNWGQVCPDLLIDKLPGLQERFSSASMDKCWFEYWEERILKACQ